MKGICLECNNFFSKVNSGSKEKKIPVNSIFLLIIAGAGGGAFFLKKMTRPRMKIADIN
jgi:hypothetical protein